MCPGVLHSGVPVHRDRPAVNITLKPELLERVDALVSRLPGATRSAVMDELVEASLPLYESMAEALIGARDEHGNIDESKAKDRAAQGIASIVRKSLDQLGSVHYKRGKSGGGADDG